MPNRSHATALCFLLSAACVSETKREIASINEKPKTTLSGTRVNPVRYILGPKWKVKLHDGEKNNWEIGELKLKSYTLSKPEERAKYLARIQEIQAQNQLAAEKNPKKKGFLAKASQRALEEIEQLLLLVESSTLSERDRNDAFTHIIELNDSFNYNFKYPIPRKLWIAAAPIRLIDELDNPAMTSDRGPAINVIAQDGTDLSKVDPPESSFWKNPGDIKQKNFYLGFNRTRLPEFKEPCVYDEPKTSYGVHGGFTLQCKNEKWQFKFGEETKTEPFNSRLVWALGFNAIPVDYVPQALVVYDRKLIKEYNDRKDFGIELKSLLGFKYKEVSLQYYYDPFRDALVGAILSDGTSISAMALKAKLLKVQKDKAEQDDRNYNEAFEKTIKYLVLREASVETPSDENEKSLGPWSWSGLDHPYRRETRSFGIIAAYLNLFDARTDNNRLRMRTEKDGTKHLLHYVSDLGSGLGSAKSLLRYTNGIANDYPWDMIEKRRIRNDSPLERGVSEEFDYRYIISDYSTTQSNRSFKMAQVDDAKWIVRRLAQVSEAQLQDALIAAGWSAAETKLYLEKLLSRRDNLITTLDLGGELPLSRPQGVNRKFNFDPEKDGVPWVSYVRIRAPDLGLKIVGGKVVPRK